LLYQFDTNHYNPMSHRGTREATMRAYIPSPEVNTNPDVPMFSVTVNDSVCATDAYTLKVPSAGNRYIAAVTLTMTDDECDLLVEELAAARAKRLMSQEAAYETLHAKFGGTWDNAPAPTEGSCPTCGGSGQTGPADDPESCNSCRGTGVITE
jgi:hypothetical protein